MPTLGEVRPTPVDVTNATRHDQVQRLVLSSKSEWDPLRGPRSRDVEDPLLELLN